MGMMATVATLMLHWIYGAVLRGPSMELGWDRARCARSLADWAIMRPAGRVERDPATRLVFFTTEGDSMKAMWNGVVLASSRDTIEVEGNHYFPLESLNLQFFEASASHTTCPWKGVASYYTLKVGAALNTDAAWYYPDPKPAAERIRGRVAFWRGVQVSRD